MKFYDTDLFCNDCLTHERFWTWGQSWSPDICPCRSEDVTSWRRMNEYQRKKS